MWRSKKLKKRKSERMGVEEKTKRRRRKYESVKEIREDERRAQIMERKKEIWN